VIQQQVQAACDASSGGGREEPDPSVMNRVYDLDRVIGACVVVYQYFRIVW
jgi:hypothetical protein